MVAEGGEGENPLPFSLTAPKRGWGGGGGGGVGGVSRLRFPPGPHLRSSRFSLTSTPSPGSHQDLRKIVMRGLWFWGKGARRLGARAPSPLETWPTGGPWGLDPATLTEFFNFLLRLKPISPYLKTLGCYPWGALDGFRRLQSHERRGSRLRSSISAAGLGWAPSP